MSTTVAYTEKPEDYQFSITELNNLFTNIKAVVDGKLDVRGDTLGGNMPYLRGIFNLPADAPAGSIRRRTDKATVPEPMAITVAETDYSFNGNRTDRTVDITTEAIGDTVLAIVTHRFPITSVNAGAVEVLRAASGDSFNEDQPKVSVYMMPVTKVGNISFKVVQGDRGRIGLVTLLLRGGVFVVDNIQVADSTYEGFGLPSAPFNHPMATSSGGAGIAVSMVSCQVWQRSTHLHSAGWTHVTPAGTYDDAFGPVAYRMVADGEEVTGTCAHSYSSSRHSGVSVIVRLNCIAESPPIAHPELELVTITQANLTTAVSENFRRVFAALNYKAPLDRAFTLEGDWSMGNFYGIDPLTLRDYGPTSAGENDV
ncbi:MAG: hypothetical protein RBS78_01025 [Coriobacteriia bacterium]|jgi:hypothetical protein|nr:hypothetical protein [Coriobacteriia bacterium]